MVVAGDISFTESFQHHPVQLFGNDLLKKLELDARENFQDADGNLFQLGYREFIFLFRHNQSLMIVHDVDSYVCQHRIVRRSESHQLVGGNLCGAIAPQEFSGKIQADLVCHPVCGDEHGIDEIVPAVTSKLAKGNLRTGKNNGFLQSLQHKGKCRSRVGHGVCAVKHHKTVVIVIAVANFSANVYPLLNRNVCGVQKGVELDNVPVGHILVL